MLTLEHCSKVVLRDKLSKNTTLKYVGTEAEVDAKIATLKFGVKIGDYGYLLSWEKLQVGGVLYAVTIKYNMPYSFDGNIPSSGDDSNLSVFEKSTLDCAILQMPLEFAAGYQTRWNHYLIGKGSYATTVPSFWYIEKDSFIDPSTADFKRYRWIKQLSLIPTEKDPLTSLYWQVVKSGGVTCKPIKLGCLTYDYRTYTITEVSLFKTKEAAGAAASKSLNKIVTTPKNGDFGVTRNGCDWKVDGAQVQYDGDVWTVTTTYTMSGYGGWDLDLYDRA